MSVKGKIGPAQITISFCFFAVLAATVWLGGDAIRLLLAAAVHEGGHLAAVFFCGGKIRSVEFGGFGIRIRPFFSRLPSARREAAMLLAGPAAGFAACVPALLCGRWRFALLSAGLSCFNLLPFPGLDGGGLLVLGKKYKSLKI